MSSSSGSDLSSSENEEIILKELPNRSTRGSRMNQLLGEEAEADDTFWGQDAFQEEEQDEEYSTEEGNY